ncbi:preprotein translocase subunit SecE [Jiangella aurantiaca]|uniref:Protein translocase subunit SecE n=1 Tax=Jiangella aurantiaca TaxID=2530373 RepID=A0A4R5AJG1_9ACTN|nr:preprotein translocase subunit SecE [Jiangella aurantiaca]TDD71895.1 preprotein translocase subunit SecE [Jiangella aurantiaca]
MTETSGKTAIPERPRSPRRRGPFARLSLWTRQVVAELRKVVYPTRKQLLTYTAVVLVFVAIMITVVSLLDLGLGWAMFEIFG